MDEGIRLRVADAPLGGARIAWSYLGSLIAALLATLFWSAWSPFGTLRCDAQDTTCLLGWNITGWVLGMTARCSGMGAASPFAATQVRRFST